MSDAPSLAAMPSQLAERVTAETDYRQITDALMQTQRGRRFLAEHARRCRQTQQADLLAALARLERAIAIDRELPGVTKLRSDLAALAGAVERVRTEVTALRTVAPPDRLRPENEEMLQLLREQSTRLDALADIWTHANSPASLKPSRPQPAVEASASRGKLGNGQEPREQAAIPARNAAADGAAGEPYGAATPASDLLRQTPIFDLAFDSAAATKPTAGAVATSEETAEAAEHVGSGERYPEVQDDLTEPAALCAIVQDAIEQGGKHNEEPSERHPEEQDDLPEPAARFAIVQDAIEHGGEHNEEPSERHPEEQDDLPEPAAPFAIVQDAIEHGGEHNEEPSERHPEKQDDLPEPAAPFAIVQNAILQGGAHYPVLSELVRLIRSDRLTIDAAPSDSAETAFAQKDDLPEPEQRSRAPEFLAAAAPAASTDAEPPSASLTAEFLPVSAKDEAASPSVGTCDTPTAVAATGHPLAPLLALSEEERIALFT